MSWSRLVTLDCDGEPCWSGPYDSNTDDVQQARINASHDNGWSNDGELDFCKKCTKAREGN